MLHRVFMDLTKEPSERLLKVEHQLGLDVYDMIYGDMEDQISRLPDSMLTLYDHIPMPRINRRRKKAKRVKGSIESSSFDSYQFKRFSNWLNLDRTDLYDSQQEIYLPMALAQVSRGNRCALYHMETLEKRGLMFKALLKRVEARYIEGCIEGEKIMQPIFDVMEGITEILLSVKTTKGLFSAWPECEKYVHLPEESAGLMMKVDVGQLNKSLDSMYPPAEKSEVVDEQQIA